MGGSIGSAGKIRKVRELVYQSFFNDISFSFSFMNFFLSKQPVGYFKMKATDSTDVEICSTVSSASINGRIQVSSPDHVVHKLIHTSSNYFSDLLWRRLTYATFLSHY